MLIEIHMLQNLSPSNPNRDNFGAPKTAIFGGKLRARISSQCLKRDIRGSRDPKAPDEPVGHFQEALRGHVGIRTRLFPQLVAEALKNSTMPEEDRPRIVAACRNIAKAEEGAEKAKPAKNKGDNRPRTPQLIFVGPGEAREFVRRLGKLRDEMKDEYECFLDPKAMFEPINSPAQAMCKSRDSA